MLEPAPEHRGPVTFDCPGCGAPVTVRYSVLREDHLGFWEIRPEDGCSCRLEDSVCDPAATCRAGRLVARDVDAHGMAA